MAHGNSQFATRSTAAAKHASALAGEAAAAASFPAREGELYGRLFHRLYDSVYLVDRDRRIIQWNEAAEDVTGYAPAETCGKHCSDNLLVHVDEHGKELCKDGCPLQQTLDDAKPREALVYLRHKQGHRVPVLVRTEAVKGSNGEVVAALEVFRDESSTREFTRRISELERLAYVDELTQVPNRRYAELRVGELINRSQQLGWSGAVALLDLDNFKLINDRWGHAAGDAVLKSTARTVVNALRGEDTIGRWGGEEFLLVLPGIRSEIMLESLADRCRVLVAASEVKVGRTALKATASFGATLVKPDDTTDSIIARVDSLLYRSKREGRNRVSVG